MLGYNLVQRDPALAAAMGAFKGRGKAGPDFGADFGDDYGDDVGLDAGADFGLDAGDDFGRAPVHSKPHPAAVAKVWNAHARGQAIKQRREMLLNPNKGSALKVEAYKFSISLVGTTGVAPVLGTATALSGTGQPDVNFRPMRVLLNVPSVGLVLVNEIKVGNVSGTVGGISDGFEYSPLAVNTQMSLPMMTPSTKASFIGSWTSFVPPGFVGTSTFTLVMSFVGWATMDPGGF